MNIFCKVLAGSGKNYLSDKPLPAEWLKDFALAKKASIPLIG